MLQGKTGFTRIALLCLILTSQNTFAGQWFTNFNLGLGSTEVGTDNRLTLITSTTPPIVNGYDTNSDKHMTGLIGAGAGYRFDENQPVTFALGGTAYFMSYRPVNGTVHPMINVAPDFDTLNYSYNVVSALLMVEPTIILYSSVVRPYVSLGLGAAWNKFYNYCAVTTIGSTSAPASSLFQNNYNVAFAYAPSIGIEYVVSNHVIARMGYQFIHAGYAESGTASSQETSQRLKSNSLNTNLFTLSFLFA
jgi:opacity protein-like surface antigen